MDLCVLLYGFVVYINDYFYTSTAFICFNLMSETSFDFLEFESFTLFWEYSM
jgi:hypothetical protein